MDEKSQISRGFVWLGAASTITAIIDGLSSLVIIWFLTREQMGVATLAWAVAVFLEAFNGLGIGIALVQAKELSARQRSFCHSYAIAFAVLSTGGMCLAAPLIASFYGSPALTPMICVSAVKLLFVGACLVPLQSLNRDLDFPKVSLIVTVATFLAACTRIGLAAAGTGAWAPVIGNTAHGLFVFLGTLAFSRHWPRPAWAWRESRALVWFGLKLTSSGALYQFYRNADFFFVGRMLGTEILGLYRVAYDLAMVPALMVLNVVNRASFPVYSRIAGDRQRLANTFIWNTRNLSLLVFPLCLLIGFMGPSILAVVGRTSQWVDGGTAVCILSVAAGLRCIDQFFPQLFAAVGRTTFSVLDAVFSTLVFCGLFYFGLRFFGDTLGILVVCLAWVAGYVFLFIPLWVMTLRIVPLTLGRFLLTAFKDAALGTAITAAVLAGTLLLLLYLHLGLKPAPTFVLLGAVGLLVYLAWLRFGLKIGIKSLLGGVKSGASPLGAEPTARADEPCSAGRQRPCAMRVCIYATTFQADIQAFTLHLAAQPGVEVLLAVESEATIRKQALESFAPLKATLVEHGDPRIKEIVRAFDADVVVIDNHIPAFDVAHRVLVLWHGYGWRLDDLAQMRKEFQRHWGDVTRSNPNVLWAAFGEIDWEYRTSHSRLHPDNAAKLGSPYSDLLVPGSAFQLAFSRAAAAPHYTIDVVDRKNVLLALTWHHGSALGNFGDDDVLFDRLFAALDARNANVIMRMHDRHRFEPSHLEKLERIAARHRNVQLKFKNEHPDALVDLSVSDVMVSNYSSILNHFYFMERPTVHIHPADASGRYTEFQWKRGKLRKRADTAAADVWKVQPDDIGGLHAASFPALLDAVSRALDEPDCCREASTSFVRKHYTGADGRSCDRVLEAMRRRWALT